MVLGLVVLVGQQVVLVGQPVVQEVQGALQAVLGLHGMAVVLVVLHQPFLFMPCV